MPKKETRTLAIILLLVNILYIVAFAFLFFFTKNMVAESISIEDQIKTELKKEDMMILMKEDIASGKIYQEKLIEYAVSATGTVGFIEILEGLASSSDVKSEIKGVSSKSYDKGNVVGVELMTVNMHVIGEWKNVHLFLEYLESYPLKIDIKRASLSKFSDYFVKGKNIPEWHGDFDFTVVKFKEKK